MSCNATVERVNSVEARDQSKQDRAPDQSCWQTQQHCCTATVSLALFLFSLCRGMAIFRTGSSFTTAPTTTTHFSPHNSSLHITPTSASILTLHLHPMYSLHIQFLSFNPDSWSLWQSWNGRGSASKLRRRVRGQILLLLCLSYPCSLPKDTSCVQAGPPHVWCQCEFWSYCVSLVSC